MSVFAGTDLPVTSVALFTARCKQEFSLFVLYLLPRAFPQYEGRQEGLAVPPRPLRPADPLTEVPEGPGKARCFLTAPFYSFCPLLLRTGQLNL